MSAGSASFGRYELLRRLGGGGMGEVWLARAPGAERVQKTVVLKRLRPDRSSEQARARFVDEARVAVALTHPHIVPVFEFGERDGEYFLVMEWVRGGDLAGIAGVDHPPLGWQAVALLGSELCDALAYVHARTDRRGAGLVHGDVTPGNLLLSPDGHALLGDFGLARFAPQGRAGTVRYQSPEQARGESLDGRADLFALALVLCEAATGQPAYDRDPVRATVQARVGVVPALDGCDAELARVLRSALAALPAQRPRDAAALGDAFAALLAREPRARAVGRRELVERVTAARHTGAGETRGGSTVATKAATRVPRRRAVGAAFVAGLAAALVGVWMVRARPPAPVATPRLAEPARSEPLAKNPPPLATATPAPPLATATPAPPPRQRLPARPRPATVVAAPAPAAPSAWLDLNATPWAHVRIDERDIGDTPLFRIELSSGRHVVELINEPLSLHRELIVDLHPGEHARRIEDLRR